jgi:NADPH:quinone reductase-like Zn-dependent oxidoreductase
MREGESVVVHAAAGGVGSLAVQLGKAFGAGRVIATASSEEKRELALDLGADVAVDVTREDLADALREMFAEPLQDLFARTASGELRVIEGPVYPLSEARRAHEDLRARRTTGKLVLDPAS